MREAQSVRGGYSVHVREAQSVRGGYSVHVYQCRPKSMVNLKTMDMIDENSNSMAENSLQSSVKMLENGI